MELVVAIGCLLTELGHEHLVAFAQDRALSLQANRIEIDEQGEVFVHTTLSYKKHDSGFLAPFCPDQVAIDKFWLPWAGSNLGWVQVSGIPQQFRVHEVFLPGVIHPVVLFGNDLTITLKDGEKSSGRIWISPFFNEKFSALKNKPELRLALSASTVYQVRPKNNFPEWFQDRFEPWIYGGLSRDTASRRVTFENIRVRSKTSEPAKNP